MPDRLLAWYDRHARLLPWRARPGERADPYRVWLSEIMLQQTTVVAVGPYFRDFLARYMRACAEVSVDGAIHYHCMDWKGLATLLAAGTEVYPEQKNLIVWAKTNGGMGSFYANMPDEVTLTVNGNHPIFQNILKEQDHGRQEKLVRNLGDLALLSQGLLKGNDLTSFISRSVELMEGAPKNRIILEA